MSPRSTSARLESPSWSALAVGFIIFLTLLLTVGTGAVTAEPSGDRTLPDEASSGDTIEIAVSLEPDTDGSFTVSESFSENVVAATVSDTDGGIIESESSEEVSVAYTARESIELSYEVTIEDEIEEGDEDPTVIESISHPDVIGTDSVIVVTEEGSLTVSVPPGSEFSNSASGTGADNPPRIIVPDDILVFADVSNPTDGERTETVGLGVFHEDEIDPESPPPVHKGSNSNALGGATGAISLEPDETATIETTVEFSESDTGTYYVVATTRGDDSVTQLTAEDSDGFEDVEQWEQAYDRELEWVPPRAPPNIPLDPEEYYEMWNGIPTRPGTVEDRLAEAAEDDALIRAAAFYDFHTPGPNLRADIWNDHTHTTYVETPDTLSNYPTSANLTDSHIIKNAYLRIGAVSPSTHWHTEAEEDPTHLVKNNASMIVGTDYRLEEPTRADFLQRHSTSSSALAVRFSPSPSTSMDSLEITANGNDVTNETVRKRGGSKITYGTLVEDTADNSTQELTLSVETRYSYENIVDVEELICVEREDGDCVSTEWVDAGTLVYTDDVTVADSREVAVLSTHPDRREVKQAVLEEVHDGPEGTNPVGNSRTQYTINTEGFWAGVEILTDNVIEDSVVKGSHYFYTKRNKDWDTHVQQTETDKGTYTSTFTPVELHAYPVEESPHIQTGGAEIIEIDVAGTTDAPAPPSGINASTRNIRTQGNSIFSPATPYEHPSQIIIEEYTNPIRDIQHIPVIPEGGTGVSFEAEPTIVPPNIDVDVESPEDSNNQTLHITVTDPQTGTPLSDRTLTVGSQDRTIQTDANGEATIELLPSEAGVLTPVRFNGAATGHYADSEQTYANKTVMAQTYMTADLSAVRFFSDIVSFVFTIFPWITIMLVVVLTAKGISGAKSKRR